MDFYPGGFESDLYESAGRKNAHDQKWMMQTNDVAECAIFMLSRPDDMHVQELIVTKSFREEM
jgi:NADP-dependent 3-hydroxy acid dehydrogenase YdfG